MQFCVKVRHDLFYSQRKDRALNAPFIFVDENAPRVCGYTNCNRSHFNSYLPVSLSPSRGGVFQLEDSCQYFLILSRQFFEN